MRNDVLYTFRRCPYAIRARWAILISNVVVIAREVDLKNKPNEMLEASAKGTVPVLVLENGKVIDESFEIMKWAISKSTQLEYIINSYKIYNNEIDNIIREYKKVKKRKRSNLYQVKKMGLLDKHGKPLK